MPASASDPELSLAARAFRAFHGLITAAFLLAILEVWWCALTGRRDRWLRVAVASLVTEGVVVAANHGDCPLGGLQDRLGDPTPLFELALSPRAARRAVPGPRSRRRGRDARCSPAARPPGADPETMVRFSRTGKRPRTDAPEPGEGQDRAMTQRPALLILAIASAAALTATGCGGSTKTVTTTVSTPAAAATDTTATTAPASTTAVKSVDMIMTDFKFAPDNVTVAAGKVPITQKNAGGVEHEFVLLKTDQPADSFPLEGSQINEDKAGTPVGEIEDVAPGKSKSKTFNLKPGKYVFVCNLPGHYSGGMFGSMTVQ